MDLAEKYRTDLEEMTVKFNEVNDYIKDARGLSFRKNLEHSAFIAEEGTRSRDIDDARAAQAKMDYSSLNVDLLDLKREIKN